MITLEEAKSYLRVDFDDEDEMIESLIQSSIKHSMDVARVNSEEDLSKNPNGKIAVLYVTAYLYEHREEADYSELNLTLRALLFGDRKPGF
ncbi:MULTISPECIES: head-tail connector protein [Bacillota]|uniref:head-tail connector protein n=1 Tax=Bacillota TaxID=1239 RepID=UPI00030990D9|nr:MULTISPECIES: head-tail connector protein [Bacillota]OCL73151.1 AraC family transcriptional regulator [Streptococcus agalactiae]OCM59807.1 AraC family transcriptional regulator [Streptococcus agalactiae]OCM80772.1 AraC family transcriptional regulator [Streptococcus agalactiae]OCM83035.1 AraC family transcriptional regulator [Streptococcus agalactiae]